MEWSKHQGYIFVIGSITPHNNPPFYYDSFVKELYARGNTDIFYIAVPTTTITSFRDIKLNIRNTSNILKKNILIFWETGIYRKQYQDFSSKIFYYLSSIHLYTVLYIRKKLKNKKLIYVTNFPEYDSILDWIPSDYSIYDCMDIYKPDLIIQNTDRLKKFDLILNHSNILQPSLSHVNAKTYLISSGHVSNETHKKNLRKFKNSIVFCGGISRRIDFKLLSSIINKFHEYDFYFVGEVYFSKYYALDEDREYQLLWENILRKKNVHYLGNVPSTSLVPLLSIFSYGIIPYKKDETPFEYANSYTLPMKMFDYMSAHLPILTTYLPAVTSHAKEFPIYSFNNPEEFGNILNLLSKLKSDLYKKTTLNKFLHYHSLKNKVDQMLTLLDSVQS